MSEASKAARTAMKSKIARLISPGKKSKIDASDFTPADPLDTESKTGLRPLSRRQFKKGGKVVAKAHGEEAHKHAGRKPRKNGGKALTANTLVNRDVREANEERDGTKHIGGFKRGGATKGRKHRADGGFQDPRMAAQQMLAGLNSANVSTGLIPSQLASSQMSKAAGIKRGGRAEAHPDEREDKALIKKMVKGEALKHRKAGGTAVSNGTLEGTRPTGGRMARAAGGKTGKGKTNINIVISPHGAGQQPQQGGMMPPGGMPSHLGGMPVAVPPPMAPPQQGMPMGMPQMAGPVGAPPMPPQMPPMGRKSGGRTTFPKMEFGAGGGEGRMEKINKYGLTPPKNTTKQI